MTALVTIAVFIALGGSVQAERQAVSGSVVDETGAVLPDAVVTLSGSPGHYSTQSDRTGAYVFHSVPPGTYELTVTLDGFVSETERDLVIGTSGAEVPAIRLKLAQLNEVVVVSASKVSSPLIDAPATMSIVTADTIAAAPAQNYADLLRGVPGTNVIQLSARDVNLTSREATSTLATSQLVLLDGRSIYLDFFGFVMWDLLPNSPTDIKQIEVIRGPASAVWGANAQTGVVNIISKTPRETVGTIATFTGGLFSRNTGSTKGSAPGALFGANVTVAEAPSDRTSYRISAGYFSSDAFPRPTGQIPVIPDPRIPSTTVGGGFYPAFVNTGTRQPKFDARVDQEFADGGRLTYSAGVAGTTGIIHTGIGPHDIQPGSILGYAKVDYGRGPLKLRAFGNFLDAQSLNLLTADPKTGAPLQLNFTTQTYDIEFGHSKIATPRHLFSYGGNVKRSAFDITITPAAPTTRNEFGAYLQDDLFFERFRFAIGGRVDKLGNLDHGVFSPRLAMTYKPGASHALRVSFNRAFRAPSVVNNYLDESIVAPQDLHGLAPFLPPALRPLVDAPFPLVLRAAGSDLPIGANAPRGLKEESLTAYEIGYTGTLANRTTLGVAFYINDIENNIRFSPLSPALDPYTDANPPPGWPLPPGILTGLAQAGLVFPHTAFSYLNLGPLRYKGVEISLDHRVSRSLATFANYSWQGKPAILDAPQPFPSALLTLPPTHRLNAGANFNGIRLLGSLSLNYSDRAFWSDVLNSPFYGFTDTYTMVNASVGMRWRDGRLTTSIKCTNLFNEHAQQHIFGDIITRQAVAEVRLARK